jgi:iron complex outermembrane receptor protein
MLSRGRRTAAASLLMGVAFAAISGTAFAQASAAKDETLEEVVVTGSRIRGVPPVGSALIAVDRDDIVASGAVTTTQLLQQLPQVFNLGISETSRGQGGASNITYGSSVNIRGIGPYATLVLVNGHRVVPQGTSGFAIDPSVLPTIGLERVDVVADGASAIYGSDAVAGVVNLITRRNVEGGEISVRYGDGDHYDEHQIGILLGHKWSTGQFTLAFENARHSSLSGLDRSYYRADLRDRGGNDFRPTLCNPGNIVVGGVSYAIPAGGVTAANRSALVAATVNKCDNLKIADLIPRQDHDSFEFTFNQEINERVSVYAEGFAHRREFNIKGGAINAAVTVPSTNPFFVAPPGLTPATETVQYSFINDYPQPYQDGYSQAVNLLVGADVKLFHDWRGGLNYSWGRNQDEQFAHTVPNGPALTAALNSRNAATALNVFGGANSQAVIDSILIGYSNAKGRSIFQTWEAKADGPLFALPGGEVRAAIGYEGQRLEVSSLQILGTVTAKTGPGRYFARGVNSFYGELLIPLVGPDNALPGIRALELNLAGRYDDYSDVGSTTNPKVGVNWSPLEGLTFHGSWGESFRAPTIAQIYGNSNNLFIQNYSDPTCGCVRQGVARSGGNLNLKPETARTYSLGGEWAPSFLPGARISVTYFDIKYENQVTAFLADLSVLQREAQFAGTGVITRNPSAAFIAQQIAETNYTGTPLPNPVLVFVDGRSANTGVTLAEGVDFQASYQFTTDDWGSFLLTGNGTRFTKYLTAITPASPLINNKNVIFNPLKLRARYGVRWTKDEWSADVFANYQNSYTNNLSTPVQKVKSSTTIDARIAWNVGDKFDLLGDVTVAVDARNLFDKNPPFVNIAESANGGGGFDPTLQSPVGRVLAITVGSKF